MSKIEVKGPHRNGDRGTSWDVTCDRLEFVVTFEPAEGPEKDDGDWIASVIDPKPVERHFAQGGDTKTEAFERSHKLATSKGALLDIDWPGVTEALSSKSAFR